MKKILALLLLTFYSVSAEVSLIPFLGLNISTVKYSPIDESAEEKVFNYGVLVAMDVRATVYNVVLGAGCAYDSKGWSYGDEGKLDYVYEEERNYEYRERTSLDYFNIHGIIGYSFKLKKKLRIIPRIKPIFGYLLEASGSTSYEVLSGDKRVSYDSSDKEYYTEQYEPTVKSLDIGFAFMSEKVYIESSVDFSLTDVIIDAENSSTSIVMHFAIGYAFLTLWD